MYIANRAFGGLRKFRAIYEHRQIVDLAFKMNKIKTKYNDLAQCKPERLSLSTALLAIYLTLYNILRMSKYENLKLKLQNNSKDDKFEINLIHFTDSEEFDFEFENSTYWIERGLLEFYDNGIKMQYVELMLINPRERKKTTHRISVNNPFKYNIKGKLIDKGNNILLKIKSISYLLEKNKKYILKFKSEKVVNELEIIF